jgi:hypothetical protein
VAVLGSPRACRSPAPRDVRASRRAAASRKCPEPQAGSTIDSRSSASTVLSGCGDGVLDDRLERAVEEHLNQAVGRVVAARGLAGVALGLAAGRERKLRPSFVICGYQLEKALVDAAQLLGPHVAPVHARKAARPRGARQSLNTASRSARFSSFAASSAGTASSRRFPLAPADRAAARQSPRHGTRSWSPPRDRRSGRGRCASLSARVGASGCSPRRSRRLTLSSVPSGCNSPRSSTVSRKISRRRGAVAG